MRSENHVELSIASPAEGGVLHVELHDFIMNTSQYILLLNDHYTALGRTKLISVSQTD